MDNKVLIQTNILDSSIIADGWYEQSSWNAWEVVETMHFISKEFILMKEKNGHANPRRGNATIINFNTLSGYMLIAILWSSYSSYLISFAFTIDTHYWALPNSSQISRWNLVVDNNMTITDKINNSLWTHTHEGDVSPSPQRGYSNHMSNGCCGCCGRIQQFIKHLPNSNWYCMQTLAMRKMTIALANLEVLYSLRMFEGYHMDYDRNNYYWRHTTHGHSIVRYL